MYVVLTRQFAILDAVHGDCLDMLTGTLTLKHNFQQHPYLSCKTSPLVFINNRSDNIFLKVFIIYAVYSTV